MKFVYPFCSYTNDLDELNIHSATGMLDLFCCVIYIYLIVFLLHSMYIL